MGKQLQSICSTSTSPAPTDLGKAWSSSFVQSAGWPECSQLLSVTDCVGCPLPECPGLSHNLTLLFWAEWNYLLLLLLNQSDDIEHKFSIHPAFLLRVFLQTFWSKTYLYYFLRRNQWVWHRLARVNSFHYWEEQHQIVPECRMRYQIFITLLQRLALILNLPYVV